MRMLRMLSLCAGIGGADLAAEWTGAIEVVGQVENDPFCQAVLAQRWPQVKRMGTIQEVTGDEFGPIDLVVGGIPCGPFSRAGKQRGKEDDRYLWPFAFAIIQRAHPTWVLIENVADFAYLALDDVSTDLESQDYTVQAFVLPACAIGAPHQRARCFVVAYSVSGRFQECQDPKRLHHQSDAPGARRMADAHGDRQWQWTDQPQCQPQCSTTSNAGADGTQKPLADANRQRSQVGDGCPALGWAPAAADRCAWGQAESEPGGGVDGLSARLDGHRWPALPCQEQERWEPPRTITGKHIYRNKRLKALGNAIVPQQVYPLFYWIVEWERKVCA